MPTLEQIQAKLKKLQQQADVLIARKAQTAVDQIRELMLKHGLTTADIEAQAKARRTARGLNGVTGRGRGRPAGVTKAAKAATPAKYRDPKTGATWTGHGRAPGWIANVKDRTSFLVDGASEMKSAAAPAKRGKGQPKGAQPPKYINPKTGATWSGRGPAPAWLATVKDRSKFLIDGAAAPASTKAAAKTGKAKATAAKKAVAKKATRKTAAKKAVAKKAVAKKATPASRKAAVKKTAGRKSAVKTAAKAPARKAAAKSAAAPAAPAAAQTSAVQASAA
ncbi:H-NS family nucleoid-associated regulatory protein [Paraburkholderia antibiotica]|uniref:H-NS histone family protein n=1 Tax=Paraburkholderia antibiotica TaxID=2728839 RepID=A0A7Y0A0T5_9BURK|nr:H-NS family nucleoid-associated regulatory protein [Paraburkholderia antibiotica]NML34418.1 H-NS histone family protein [Paraburkholderia antibiotica]